MQQPVPNSGSWGHNNEKDCSENENRLETAKQSTQGWVNDHENPWVNDCENPHVTDTITAADVLAVPEQGITGGDFSDLLRILKSGNAYVNVHTVNHLGGEIRGQ